MNETPSLRDRAATAHAAQTRDRSALDDVCLVVAGDAAENQRAAALRAEANLKRKVRYAGPGDDVPDSFRHHVVEGRLAVTSATGQVRIDGLASRTDTGYQMYDAFGPYTEVVKSGAFKKTLAANPMVVFLTNHGGLPLATTKNGDLTLNETDDGLTYQATMPLADPDVYALAHKVARGTVTENSMMFYLIEARWSDDFTTRTITEIDLDRGDVGPVLYGANPHTPLSIVKVKKGDPDDSDSDALAASQTLDPDEVRRAAEERAAAKTERVDTAARKVGGERSNHDWLAMSRRRASAEAVS